MFFTSNASGQWYINTSTNLETDIAGTFGTYVNVAVDNHLSVNTNTTTCPLATSASATFDYPFVVNDINSGTTNIGTAIVLWDNGGDHIRKIIGLSPAGGVAIYSGNDDQTGSGIRLNSSGSSTAGLVQAISQVPGTNKAFEHLNYASGTLNSIYSINGNGDVLVTGKQTSQKYLSINLNSTPACPSVTGGSTMVDYPLVVNDISGSGTAIVLWDNTADPIRNIIGLSPAGGVAMYSGNDDHTGSGIRLNAPGSTTYPAGSVQTISTATATGPGIPAFEHYSYAPLPLASTATMNRVFSVTDNGDIKVAGKLSFPFLGGDNGFRLIEGLSPCWGIKMYTGDPITPGTQIVMTSPIPPIVCSTPTGYTQGLMQFRADALGATGIGLSYDFTALNPTAAAALHCMRINNNSNASIGPFTAPTPTDRLAVDGNLYLNSFDNNDTHFRNIFAKSSLSGLNVSSGALTDGSDGACFTAYAWDVPSGSYPAPTYPGAFIIKSNDNKQDPLGFAYESYIGPVGGGGTLYNVFSASKYGNGIFGFNTTLNNIANNDIFTVQQSLGFYSPSDPTTRLIHGETHAGDLSISSYTDYTTGSNIDLFGASNSANPGQIIYTSNTASIPATTVSAMHPSMIFTNYDGTAQTNNFVISDDGHGIFGHGTNLGNIVAGDIFTVKSQMGFFDPVDANWRSLNGNTNTGALKIDAKTSSADGSNIELYGASHASRPGQIHFSSAGTTGYSMVFNNFDGSLWHKNVAIMNNGKTTVGHDLDPAGLTTSDVLTVLDKIGFYSSGGDLTLNGNTTTHELNINASYGSNDGPGVEFYGKSYPVLGGENRAGSMHYYSYGDPTVNAYGHMFGNYDITWPGWRYTMAITKGGKVIIGTGLIDNGITHIPGNYDLYVEHGILTEHVRVASSITPAWADFVFNTDYDLMPLATVEKYVKANKHLPDIPSAKEVAKDGIDVEGMDAKLLQKIEELTLYVIQQQKRIDELEKKLEKKN